MCACIHVGLSSPSLITAKWLPFGYNSLSSVSPSPLLIAVICWWMQFTAGSLLCGRDQLKLHQMGIRGVVWRWGDQLSLLCSCPFPREGGYVYKEQCLHISGLMDTEEDTQVWSRFCIGDFQQPNRIIFDFTQELWEFLFWLRLMGFSCGQWHPYQCSGLWITPGYTTGRVTPTQLVWCQ